MFDSRDNSGALDPFNTKSTAKGLQDRVVAETFPIYDAVSSERALDFGELTSATSRLPSKRPYTWAKVDVHAFTPELFAYGYSSAEYEVFVPCRTGLRLMSLNDRETLTSWSYSNACGERRVMVRVSHS